MQQNKSLKIKDIILVLNLISTLILSLVYTSYSINLNIQEYIKLEIDNNIKFQIDKNSKSYINYFNLKSSFFPQNYENVQYLNQFNTTHQNYKIINESSNLNLLYKYDKDEIKNENIIKERYILETIAYRPQIKSKQKYPINFVKDENKIYLSYKDLIDINEDIKTKASQLAQGEDDVYIIASKIAKWIVENINYDLKTALLNPDQKSSQVFKSKSGVCKEISNLYVSMMRSLGIPTRLVTGYAYTDSVELVEFLNSNWGGHAWTEVLIGDIWVPFDLTYNQYGYVDATHITLEKSTNLKNNLVAINASGRDFSIVSNSLKISNNFNVINTREKLKNDKKFEINLQGPNQLGFSSYGYIKVNIENKKDYYQDIFLTISKTKEIELLDDNKRMIIFKPNEKKEIIFRYKIPELESGYYYTMPFKIGNEEYNFDYNLSVREEYMKIEEFELPVEKKEEKIYTNNNINFNCKGELNFRLNQIICTIKNTNNYQINNISICLKDDCKLINLKINEEKQINFETLNYNETLNYTYLNKTYNYDIKIDKPKLDYKKNINGTKIEISYFIYNYQENLHLNIYNNEQLINSSNKQKDNLSLNLNLGQNNISLKIEIKDNIYDQKEFKIDVIEEKINIWNKIIDLIKNFFNNRFFNKIF